MLFLIRLLLAHRLDVFVNSFAFGSNLELGEPAPRAAREGQGAPSARQDLPGGGAAPPDPPAFFVFRKAVLGPFWSISGPNGSIWTLITCFC